MRSMLSRIVDLLIRISDSTPLIFILHKPTEQKLAQFGLRDKLESCAEIELRPRYTYFQFIKLIKHASFVITDGGSNQEECHYLGKPCIIMRTTSERQEGIGTNAVISNYDYATISDVVKKPEQYSIAASNLDASPSAIIVEELLHMATCRKPAD